MVAPHYTKTSLEANSSRVQMVINAYDHECNAVTNAVAESVESAPGPALVTNTIVEAALGAWRMRRMPSGQAALLSILRRFMPTGAVDSSLRKKLGLE